MILTDQPKGKAAGPGENSNTFSNRCYMLLVRTVLLAGSISEPAADKWAGGCAVVRRSGGTDC